jgi:hypothetical protein
MTAVGFWLLGSGVAFAGPLAASGSGAALVGQSAASSGGPEQAASPAILQQISGRIVDQTGVAVAGARIKLTCLQGCGEGREAVSDTDGKFNFTGEVAGAFRLTITATGFARQEFSGTVKAGASFAVPQIALAIAEVITEVKVTPPQVELAEAQIKDEEKQRPLGFIPNFYVSYVPDAAPLAPKQKFELAWKTMIDPMTFAITGAIAGIQQANNTYSGYGQGADGYAKRYGAAYADQAIGTMIGGAILPSLLKQDPRYFYKGTGSKKSRVWYAVAASVRCKGDNGKWQVNYSGILGGLAAGGISNLYYPAKDREGAELTFQNALIGIGATAAANILQEFVIRKLTPNAQAHDPASSSSTKPLNQIGKMFGSIGSMVREGD